MPTDTANGLGVLTPKDFENDLDVRWCPGCGDYSILAQVKKILPTLGIPRHNIAFVSGIGCSSRFPYYLSTYGFHTVHGRAPTFATGLRLANPELSVWVVTGDGDALSIGGNHFMHLIRRNVDVNLLLFNNRIYGLTKGQYSPTSRVGHKTKSTPYGSIDRPLSATGVALAAGATFVARTIDVNIKHLGETLKRAAAHRGTSVVEIYQDCNVFNHKAFDFVTDKKIKAEHTLYVEHGKPMVFGEEGDKGIRLNGLTPEVVELGAGVSRDDLLFHDERAEQPTLAQLLSQIQHPEYPEPMGVFRDVEAPVYEEQVEAQVQHAKEVVKTRDFNDLLRGGETWTVSPDGSAPAANDEGVPGAF